MSFTITKDFVFSASHQLEDLPEDHPCSRLHGHNYTVRLELAAPWLNGVGFVFDYRGLDKFKRYLDECFDHRHLNEVIEVNPTAENLAMGLYHAARDLLPEAQGFIAAVGVSETAKTWAWYRP